VTLGFLMRGAGNLSNVRLTVNSSGFCVIIFRESPFFNRMMAPPPCHLLSMDADSTTRINQAVDAALERCARSSLPHSMLRDLLKQAEAKGSLSAEEIAAVESAALRVLASHNRS
jgi:hypothetical protein